MLLLQSRPLLALPLSNRQIASSLNTAKWRTIPAAKQKQKSGAKDLSAMHPRRGEVWWVAFDPSVGGEIQKTRPAVILSNNAANAALNRLIVVPITSQANKVYPSEARIKLNGEPRK